MDGTGNTGSDTGTKSTCTNTCSISCYSRACCANRLFWPLSGGQVGGAGLAIIGLVALLLLFAGKRKK